MPNITGHTELVGLMAYPIRHTQSPTTHNLAYDKNGDDVIQLAFEVDNDSLKDAVQSIRALKMLGSNISMPNKTVVHKYLDEVDEAAKLCGAINTVVNLRDENGQVTYPLKEKGYNPVNQLVGYILSEDPTYITTYNNARSLIRHIDRDELLQAMVKTYLGS